MVGDRYPDRTAILAHHWFHDRKFFDPFLVSLSARGYREGVRCNTVPCSSRDRPMKNSVGFPLLSDSLTPNGQFTPPRRLRHYALVWLRPCPQIVGPPSKRQCLHGVLSGKTNITTPSEPQQPPR